jgi:hypothetical protein
VRFHLVRLAIVVAILASSHGALASPRRGARLVWARGTGAEGCVGIAGLTEDVKSRLGYDAFTLASELEIEGTAQQTPRGFRADLTFRRPDGSSIGKRELESRDKDCRSIGEAVAVAITVAIDPDSPAVPSAAVEEVPPPSREETPRAPLSPPAAPLSPRGRISLAGGVSAGLLPGLSGMARLRAAVFVSERVEIGAGVAWSPEAREGAYGFDLTTGEVLSCWAPWGARGVLRACGGLLAGAFGTFVHSRAVEPVEVGIFPWLGAEAGAGLSLPIAGPATAELGASAVVPFLRRQGLVRSAPAPVWEQGIVGFRADLGVGVIF